MKNLSPTFLICFSIIVWIFFYFLSPYDYYLYNSGVNGAFFILLSFFAFLLGCQSVISSNSYNINKNSNIQDHYNFLRIRKIFYLCLFFGAIGIFFRLIDNFALSNYQEFDNLTESRFASNNSFDEESNSAFSVLGALLFPYSLSALIIYIYFKEFIKFPSIPIYLFGGFFAFESFLGGGRLNILTWILYVFFAHLIKNHLNNKKLLKFNYRTLAYTVITILIFLGYSLSITFDRLEYFGIDKISYLLYSSDFREIQIDDAYLQFLEKNNSIFSNYIFMFYEIGHYYIHGLFEFIKLYNYNTSNYEYMLGAHQFNIFFKFFTFMGVEGLPSFEQTLSGYPQAGQYTGFLGPSFIDFGNYSLIYFYLLGFLARNIYILSVRKSFIGIILYPFVATTIITSPAFHASMQSNLYFLISLIVVLLIYKTKI